MPEKKTEKQIHMSEREARQGNATREHYVVAGAMVVIALLIVGVFVYAGLGGDGPLNANDGLTKMGEPNVGPESSETERGSGQSVPGARDEDTRANRAGEASNAGSAPADTSRNN